MFLRFALISFGDGTGFEVGEPRDLRLKESSVLESPEGQTSKKSRDAPNTYKQVSGKIINTNLADKLQVPIRFGPYLSHASSSVQGECGTGNCFPWVITGPLPTTCYCQDTLLAVTASGQPCKRLKNVWFPCQSDGNVACYDDAIDEANQ